MTSSLVDYVLLAALALTSACVLATYLKLRNFDRNHYDYKRTLEATADALKTAGHSMGSFTADGQKTLVELSLRIEDARKTLASLDAGIAAARETLAKLEKAAQPQAGGRAALWLVGDDKTA